MNKTWRKNGWRHCETYSCLMLYEKQTNTKHDEFLIPSVSWVMWGLHRPCTMQDFCRYSSCCSDFGVGYIGIARFELVTDSRGNLPVLVDTSNACACLLRWCFRFTEQLLRDLKKCSQLNLMDRSSIRSMHLFLNMFDICMNMDCEVVSTHISGFDSQGSFWVEFELSPCGCVGSFQLFQLLPAVQKP